MKLKIFSICLSAFFINASMAQNVGIGTTTPKARLHVADSSVYFSSPEPFSLMPGITPTETGGIGMLWISNKAALRVGGETGTNWGYDSIGLLSASFGFNNKVSGVASFSSGRENKVSNEYAAAIGQYNEAESKGTLAFGSYTKALGDYSNAIGYGVTAQALQSTALGRYNIAMGSKTSEYNYDPLFVIGNGWNNNNRSNALTILKSGYTGIGTITPNYPLHVATEGDRVAFYAENKKTAIGEQTVSIFAQQSNAYGSAINGWTTATGSVAASRNDFAYAILGQAGNDRYAVGAFSINKSAVVAKSNSGTAIEAESISGLALNTKGDVRLTQIGEGYGKLLISDATGYATWQNPPTVTLDQLSSSGKSEITFRNQGSYVGSFGWSQASTRFFVYDQNTGTNPLVIKNGRVGLGDRDATTNMLEVNGNASKSTAGSWLANSDARLKKDIQPIKSALQKLMQLEGITYQWNDNKTGIKRPEGIQMGFTAQNIQAVFPGEVSTDAQGFLQTAYGTYDALIVEAIKELKNENDLLKKEIAEIKRLLERK